MSRSPRQEIEQRLRHADSRVRSAAALELGRLGDTNAIASLLWLAAHDHKSRAVAFASVEVLRGDRDVVPLLLEALVDERFEVRRGVVRALGLVGVAAIPALAAIIQVPALRRTRLAVTALSLIRAPAVVPVIEQALADPEPRNRKKAVLALTYLREMGHDALKRALFHSDAVVRYYAVLELSSHHASHWEHVRLCIDGLSDTDEHVRWLSASRLRWSRCLEEETSRELLAAVRRALRAERSPRVASELSDVLATHLRGVPPGADERRQRR